MTVLETQIGQEKRKRIYNPDLHIIICNSDELIRQNYNQQLPVHQSHWELRASASSSLSKEGSMIREVPEFWMLPVIHKKHSVDAAIYTSIVHFDHKLAKYIYKY